MLSKIYNDIRSIAWNCYREAREKAYNKTQEDENCDELIYHDKQFDQAFDALKPLEAHQEIDSEKNMEIDFTVKLGTMHDLWVGKIAQEMDKAKKEKVAAEAAEKEKENKEDGEQEEEADQKEEQEAQDASKASVSDPSSPSKATGKVDKSEAMKLKETLIGARDNLNLEVDTADNALKQKYKEDQENYKKLVGEMIDQLNMEDQN